jgi:hypothetical protein
MGMAQTSGLKRNATPRQIITSAADFADRKEPHGGEPLFSYEYEEAGAIGETEYGKAS